MTNPTPIERELRRSVRGEVSVKAAERGLYASDASHYQQMPAAVAVPMDEEDALAAIRAANGLGLPITARGGGTSLSGQTFGSGLVLDLSKHLGKVHEVNESEGWARVGPGVVRDRLNAQLAQHGLHFAPDPATGKAATVGGMIGNNSSGTRSVVHGKTIDHVLSLRLALADGTVIDCEEMNPDAWRNVAQRGGRIGDIHAGVAHVVERHRGDILERYPKVLRRVAGYNLDEFVDGAGYTGTVGPRAERDAGHRPWSLHNLVLGAEGTLGVVLEAKVRLTPTPGGTALCVVHFDDVIASLAAVDPMLEHGPSAIELLDHTVLDEAKINPATRRYAGFIEGAPRAVQIVEFFGNSEAEAKERAASFAAAMGSQGIGYAHPVRADATGQADVWNTRKLGLGLISNVKGPRKGQAFVEDACVPIRHLADYIERLSKVCEQRGVPHSMYAHASVGVIHFRPWLDLHREDDIAKMRAIAESAFEMAVGYGGAFAGEHGDGVVRGEFIERFFGASLYSAFREIKGLFDPDSRMNPGRIVHPPPLDHQPLMRYRQPKYAEQAAKVEANYRYEDQGGFALAVEQCNGVGACRKVGEGVMCPSYMATRDESATTRGRANTLRLAMSGQLGQDPMAALASDGVHEVLDLCLACKACKSECPNAVDMAKLKSDALQMRHDRRGTPLGARLMGGMPDAAKRIAGPLAPLVNAVQSTPPFKWALQKLAGIDRRRPLPRFASSSLQRQLQRREPARTAAAEERFPGGDEAAGTPRTRVVLFDDTYANYFEPSVGLAAVDLLEAGGYDVTIAKAGCCQRPRLSKGLVRAARAHGERTMQNLDRLRGENGQAPPILCLEPSCASALRDDLADLVGDAALGQRVAARIWMLDQFLAHDGVALASAVGDTFFHGHCHQRAIFDTGAMRSTLGSEHRCTDSNAGCCGMAGSFGYEHHDVSRKVGEDRLFPGVAAARERGDTIIAPGFSCRHQLADFCGVKAKHWVQCVRIRPSCENVTPHHA